MKQRHEDMAWIITMIVWSLIAIWADMPTIGWILFTSVFGIHIGYRMAAGYWLNYE